MPDNHRLPADMALPATGLAARKTISPPSLPPQLSGWEVSHPVPAGLDAATIDAALRRYDAAMLPASVQARTVLVKPLLDFARAHNVPCDAKALSAIYLDGLADLPVDLLEQAVGATISTWRWHNAMPTPAEIREHVAAELGRRKRERGRLQLVRRLPMPPPRDRTDPVEQAQAEAAFAAMRAEIAAAPPLQVVERRRDDDREPTPISDSIRRGRGVLTGLTLEQRVERAERARGGASC